MKRIGNLYDTICSTENLYAAYLKAKQGKAKSYGVVLFDKNFESNMETIQAELINACYRTSEYSIFTITDPKERLVYRLPFRDRIVHHAIMNIVGEIWVSTFISQMIISAKVSHHYGKVSHLQKLGGFVCKCSNII